MSYAFPSESYISNITRDKNVKLIEREGTQIVDDNGEVIGVSNVLSNESNNLKKTPMINNNYYIYFYLFIFSNGLLPSNPRVIYYIYMI
jgi:hypothetical protein